MEPMIYNPDSHGNPEPWQLELLSRIKNGLEARNIAVVDFDNRQIGLAKTMRFDDLETELPAIFVKWRNQNRTGWLDQRPVTLDGTRRWMREALCDPRRLNVLLYSHDNLVGRAGFLDLGIRGHMGDGLVRGERGGGVNFITFVNFACMTWDFEQLKLENMYSKVVSSNILALGSTNRLGYEVLGSVPLYRRALPDGAVLVEQPCDDGFLAEERLYYLVCSRKSFESARERAWLTRSFEYHDA